MATERLPNPFINVELELSRAIVRIGGVRVDEILGKTDKKNADFLFDKHSVIAEMKVLEVDQISTERFVSKCSDIYARYLKEGKAPVRVFGTMRLTTDRFPEEFRREIANLYSVPLGRIVKAADNQIRSTKELLIRPNHAGVLILVNNGNTAMDPSHVVWSLGEHLKEGQFPNINQVLFFTANMSVEVNSRPKQSLGIPEDMDMHVWFFAGRTEIARANVEFEPALREAWLSHLSGIVGRVAELNGNQELFSSLKNKNLREKRGAGK